MYFEDVLQQFRQDLTNCLDMHPSDHFQKYWETFLLALQKELLGRRLFAKSTLENDFRSTPH